MIVVLTKLQCYVHNSIPSHIIRPFQRFLNSKVLWAHINFYLAKPLTRQCSAIILRPKFAKLWLNFRILSQNCNWIFALISSPDKSDNTLLRAHDPRNCFMEFTCTDYCLKAPDSPQEVPRQMLLLWLGNNTLFLHHLEKAATIKITRDILKQGATLCTVMTALA